MKKIYIIPGWKEYSRYKIYQSLAMMAKNKGYEVIFYEVDWNRKMSDQIFPISKNSVIFGFSLGAIMALLVSQKYECKKLILASMTPLYSFRDKKIRHDLNDLLGKKIIDDISKNLKGKSQAKDKITMHGDRENEYGDIIVPNTGHRLNSRYIKKIEALI